MEFIVIGSILLAALLVLKYCFISVPPKNYAIFDLLGWRWRKAKEGLTFFIPSLEKEQRYSAELDRQEIVVWVMSKDKLRIKVAGSLEFVPDYDILYQYDQTRTQQKKAIEDSVKEEIGALAGTKEGEVFISQREAIQAIINCKLRLADMPHRQNEYLEVKEAGGVISIDGRIDFYSKNLKKIQDDLKKEKNDPRRSHIEESYGIDVRKYNLAEVDYSEETKKSFEEKKQAEAKLEAAQNELRLVKQFKEEGASLQEAINAAQVSVGKAKRDVHSIEGKLADINVKFGGRNDKE